MTAESGNAKEFLRNTIVQLKEGLAWNYFNCERLKYFLQVALLRKILSMYAFVF